MAYALRGGIVAAVLILSTSAHAGLIGTASTTDISIAGSAADYLQYSSGVNPQKGKDGTTSGFSSAFGSYGTGAWAMLSKFGSNAGNGTTISANGLTMVFNKSDTRHGTWSITNNDAANNVTLDLVFAMHAGNGSGAWLFDNQFIGAGSTITGTWDLNIFNDGKQYADYSNLTLFSRNVTVSLAPAAPAPAAPAQAAPLPAEPVAAAPAPAAPAPAAAAPAPAEPAPAAPAAAAPAASAPETPPASTPPLMDINLGDLLLNSPAVSPPIVEQPGYGALPQSGNGAASGTVPEPGSLAILATGLALLGATLRRRRN